VRHAFGKYVVLFALLSRGLSAASPHLNGTYVATAYAQHGITASGQYAHRHVVAADPAILPIGSRIKIKHAGRYSGEYVVADTGDKIEGRRLDIYMPDAKACKKFGAKRVKVQVVELGDGTRAGARQADQSVKRDVAQDVQKAAVGNAATEDDWAAKGKAGSTAAPAATNAKGTATRQNGKTATGTSSTGKNRP
jgi:3D (Asp-Asp-Asp) domain-containing protein